jgi:hypothetical protein
MASSSSSGLAPGGIHVSIKVNKTARHLLATEASSSAGCSYEEGECSPSMFRRAASPSVRLLEQGEAAGPGI